MRLITGELMWEDYRFKATIVKPDGSHKVLAFAATAEKYNRIESRLRRLQKRGLCKGYELHCKAFKID